MIDMLSTERFDAGSPDHLAAAAAHADEVYRPGWYLDRCRNHWWTVHEIDSGECEGAVLSYGNTVLVVLRGTDFEAKERFSLADVYADAMSWRRVRWDPYMPAGMRVAATGVYHLNRRSRRGISAHQQIVERLRLLGPGLRIFLIGHSLGAGAVQTLLARLLHLEMPVKAVFPFMSYRVWSKASSVWIQNLCRDRGTRLFRITSSLDDVPGWVSHSPPRALGARHALTTTGGQPDAVHVEQFSDDRPARILTGDEASAWWDTRKHDTSGLKGLRWLAWRGKRRMGAHGIDGVAEALRKAPISKSQSSIAAHSRRQNLA